MSTNAKIVELNDQVYSLINQEKPCTASEFLKLASTLKKFGSFDSLLKQEIEEEKANSTEYDFLWSERAPAAQVQPI